MYDEIRISILCACAIFSPVRIHDVHLTRLLDTVVVEWASIGSKGNEVLVSVQSVAMTCYLLFFTVSRRGI